MSGIGNGDMALPFPMPNDTFVGRTVVASCEYIDDERGSLVLTLLLEKEPPYFTVAHIALTDFDPTKAEDEYLRAGLPYDQGDIDVLGRFMNIVPAVDYYKDNGGDY